jgi:polysaccharide pyruvyl transferase WcaK-like protein
VIHHIYANRSNAGDWLSAQGIQSLLAASGIEEHLCDAPFVPETLARLRDAGPNDRIVIGGGGLFSSYFEPFWEGILPIITHVPTAIWGVGVCDRTLGKSLPRRDLIRAVAKASTWCVVRDALTRTFIGLPELPAPVPCPTFNAIEPTPLPARPATLLHVDHYDNVGASNFERMEAYAADHARATGRLHRKVNNTLAAGSLPALHATLEVYRSADLILTSRLHGCILAAALDRPFLAVSGDAKVDSFMHAAGLERWVCPLDAIETIPARLLALEAERPSSRVFAESARRMNRDIAQRVRQFLVPI